MWESESDLYTLSLMSILEATIDDRSGLAEGERFRALGFGSAEKSRIRTDIEDTKGYAKVRLGEHYLVPDAPSVFEQFGKTGMGGVAPTWLMFAWRRLGADAEKDQETYLRNLFLRRPKDIDEFLKMMFRVDFIDDYSALKLLINYKELSDLITRNESFLDPTKVQEFRNRYTGEPS